MTSAAEWERRIKRLNQHTPQDTSVFETLKAAKAEASAGDLALARYEGRLPYGAKGCNEDVEHRAFILWVQRDGLSQFPALQWLHHSPNEAAYRGRQGTGVSRGFSDFALFVPIGRWQGLAAELKAPGGAPSHEQRQWLAHLAGLGWHTATPYGYEACRDLHIAYLEGQL